MPIAPNLLRSQVEDFEQTPNTLSSKQRARRDRILTTGRHLLATHGLRNLRVCDLALAMNITSASIRHHFADLDALLIEILKEHGRAINEAIATVHDTGPDATAKRRAAYLAATRGPSGNFTEAHLLLLRDATMLSETNHAAIQQSHDRHGIILAGALDADIALTLLDAPRLDPLRIQAMLATLEGSDPACLAPLPVLETREVKQPVPRQPRAPQPVPELLWSDDLANVPDELLEAYPGDPTQAAWAASASHARAPPHAAQG
jgi:AcrR family transcriptional regulator